MKEFKKPKSPIINADSNIFNLMGIASKSLKQNGDAEKATEMCNRIYKSQSYHQALGIMMEYIDPVDAFEQTEDDLFYDDYEGQEM